jgi:ADP-heptose:LPS heptosyltransferase
MPLRASKMAIPVILNAIKTRHIPDRQQPVAPKAGKILLVKQSERLGNIILMNSAISGLASCFPDIKIDLLLPAPYAEVMTANSHINEIIPVYKKEYISRPWKLAALLRKLRRNKYDLAIDCSDVNSHSSTGAAYAILSGAKLVAGWRMTDRQLFDIEVERYSESVHATQMYIRLFSGIFGRQLDGQPYFDRIESAASSGPGIGINCGGRGPKRWPLEKFVEIGSYLSQNGIKVEFILGPEENKLRPGLQESLSDGCRLLPLLPLSSLMKMICNYKVFISSDTGPMHLAWCLKVPTIAIFIDSELEKFHPFSPGSVAVDGQKGITPKEIADLAVGILKSGKVSA